MSRFKPQATGYKTHHRNISSEDYPVRTETANTYRDLKKKIRNLFIIDGCDKVKVLRSRTGQWGEWFEEYRKTIKPDNSISFKKFKEGWM